MPKREKPGGARGGGGIARGRSGFKGLDISAAHRPHDTFVPWPDLERAHPRSNSGKANGAVRPTPATVSTRRAGERALADAFRYAAYADGRRDEPPPRDTLLRSRRVR